MRLHEEAIYSPFAVELFIVELVYHSIADSSL